MCYKQLGDFIPGKRIHREVSVNVGNEDMCHRGKILLDMSHGSEEGMVLGRKKCLPVMSKSLS